MDKISTMNQMHRVFLGWLHSEVEAGRVPATRMIEDMAPIDLTQNRELFEQFLEKENWSERWQQFEREHGPIETLTYFNG